MTTSVLLLVLLGLALALLVGGLARAAGRDGLGSRPSPRSRADWTDSLPEWQRR